MRRVENPPNPWVTREVEWLEPPPEARLEVYEEEARSVVAENESPDVPFRWSVNPYRGCQHACAYCYARQGHEHLGMGAGTDFETRIVVKTNAPTLLREALARPSWQGELIAFSGDTDCYQPLEASYRLTRQCLEVCLAFRNPTGLVTKAALIRRDVDILQALARVARCAVHVSIPFWDPLTARRIEPGAPTPRTRIEVVRALAAAGIPVGVLVAPIIPGLSDKDIPSVLDAAAEAGARSASAILLRLPGRVKDVFLARLKEHLPQRAGRVIQRILEVRGGRLSDPRFHDRHRGHGTYWEAVESLFEVHRRRLGLDRPLVDDGPTTYRRPGPEQGSLFDP